jgi:hypothetical protein
MSTRASHSRQVFCAASSSRFEGEQTMPTSGSAYLLPDRLGSGQGQRAVDVGGGCVGWLD